MKIINLLNGLYNKSSNLPPIIYYGGNTYYLEDYKYIDDDNCMLGYNYKLENILNDEVEIPDNKIEKIDKLNWRSCCEDWYTANKNIDLLLEQINIISDKLNEVIDIINKENKK